MKALTVVVFLVACGSSEPAPAPAPAPAAGSATVPRITCDAEIAIECPDGYENGCIGDRTTSHVCVRNGLEAKASCSNQIVLDCPDGEINSCFATPPYGTKHICVKARSPR